MSDTVTPEKRHEIMSRVRYKDTSIEVAVRSWLFTHGIRYRKNCITILGKPDVAIKKYRLAIFVNGCFWHGHEGCRNYRLPKSNQQYWKQKIDMNIARDQYYLEKLKSMGWNVIVVWECEIKKDKEETLDKVLKEIRELIDISKLK